MEPNFELNRPKVSDEEINKHKDFDGLVRQFKEQSIQKARSDVNFWKNKKVTYSTVIAGAAVLCTVTYFTLFKKPAPKENTHDQIATTQSNTKSSQNASGKTAFIQPPSSRLSVPYASYKVSAAKGGEIRHSTQSKISIPSKTFMNKQGADVVGDVEIKYREFHNQAEVIASGIPMTYDSAGTRYHLESAGMFDIRGEQNGEPVFIKPGKNITVEMASQQPADRFNQYVLDTIARNWKYVKRDNIAKAHEPQAPASAGDLANALSITEFTNSKTKALEKKIDAIPPKVDSVKTVYTKKIDQLPKAVQPTRPAKASSSRPAFELDVNYNEFPELSSFKNALFEVGTENKNFSKDLTSITWSSAEISEGPQKGKNYLLTLRLRDRTEKLVVYPALQGADYETALKQYNTIFVSYTNLLAKRVANEKRLQEEMAAKQKAYMEEQKKLEDQLAREQVRIRQEMEKQLAEQFKTMGNQQRVMRVFQVSNFGICNSDCPNSLPRGGEINAIFLAASGGVPLAPSAVYMVEHCRNLVYSLAPAVLSKMPYDPAKDYSLCILANGSMYLCGKEAFKTAISGGNKFQVSRLPDGVEDVTDFKKALGI